MQEEWKDVVGYEGLYEVSNTGKVRSINYYGKCGYSKELSTSIQNNGYVITHLYKNGKSSTKTVHRLVAMAFIPNPDNLEMVNHKDEDKTNNDVINLEWCSRSYNQIYSMNRHEERRKMFGDNFRDKATGKLTSPFTKKGVPHKHNEKVVQKTYDGEIIRYFDNPAEAANHIGEQSGNVYAACVRNARTDKGRKKKKSGCKGYVWEFVKQE